MPAGTFQVANSVVTIDGQVLGEGGLGTDAFRNTIVYDAGRYHMWYVAEPDSWLSSVQRATSTDGVHFTTVPGSKLQPPANWWAAAWYGQTATAQPIANFIRVARLGSDWVMLVWHPNDTATKPYSYNTSLWRLGPNLTATALSPIGPLRRSDTSPQGPGGRHVGVAGIVNNALYLIHQTPASLGRYTFDPAAPDTDPAGEDIGRANLFAGTPWCGNEASCPAADRSYVFNRARVLDQGGTLRVYYTLRASSGSRRDQQIYFAESTDDGLTWGDAQPVFPAASAFTVNGQPPTTLGFSGPEVVDLGGGRYRGYFDAEDADGNLVLVTASQPDASSSIAPVPSLGTGSLLLLGLLAGGWGMRRLQTRQA